jgi:hypothetical protein
MPKKSISFLETALSLYSESHSWWRTPPSLHPSGSFHSGYLKGLVQRVLLYERLDDIPSALNGLQEMERVTPSHPMIPKTREYLLRRMKGAQS